MTRSPRSARRLAATAIALFLLTGTAACGASSGSDADDGPTTTVAAGGDDETPTTEATTDTTDTTEASGGGDADEQAYVDALVSTFDADDESFTKDQVECLASEWVGIVGVDSFVAAGVTPDDVEGDDGDFSDLDIDEDTANDMVGAFDGCDVDLREIFLGSLAGEDIPADQQACLDDLLTDENIRASFVADIIGDDSVEDPLDDIGTCLGLGLDDGAGSSSSSGSPSAEPATPTTVG